MILWCFLSASSFNFVFLDFRVIKYLKAKIGDSFRWVLFLQIQGNIKGTGWLQGHLKSNIIIEIKYNLEAPRKSTLLGRKWIKIKCQFGLNLIFLNWPFSLKQIKDFCYREKLCCSEEESRLSSGFEESLPTKRGIPQTFINDHPFLATSYLNP